MFLDEPRTRNIRVAHIVGENYGSLYGVSYERDANGTIMYNIDADGVPRAVEGERKILGEGVPPLTLGFTNSFRYKNLNLNFLIDGKFGGQVFSGTNTTVYGNGLHKKTLEGRETGLTVSGIDAATDQPFTTTVARLSGICERSSTRLTAIRTPTDESRSLTRPSLPTRRRTSTVCIAATRPRFNGTTIQPARRTHANW